MADYAQTGSLETLTAIMDYHGGLPYEKTARSILRLRYYLEAPALREPWLDLARVFLRREDWHGVVWAARRALRITKRPETYLTEPEAWGELPYDLLAVALYYLGDYRHALAMGEEALKRSPMDRRLR